MWYLGKEIKPRIYDDIPECNRERCPCWDVDHRNCLLEGGDQTECYPAIRVMSRVFFRTLDSTLLKAAKEIDDTVDKLT